MRNNDSAWCATRFLSRPCKDLRSQLRGTIVVPVEQHQNGVTVDIQHREPNRIPKRLFLHEL